MEVPERIDHTVLGPQTTPADVADVVAAAAEHGTNACVPPCYLSPATDDARGVTLATVIGFPHGQHATPIKVAEAARAAADGADELDVVANAGLLKADADAAYRDDLAAVVEATDRPVKVIVEAPLLDTDELERACQLAADAGAAFVKTATGFGAGGATVADVERMSGYLPVKASGGIGSWADAAAMFEAGADRIGASSGVAIVREWRAAGEPVPQA
jgi:deoxyribose-phosphate aldolase